MKRNKVNRESNVLTTHIYSTEGDMISSKHIKTKETSLIEQFERVKEKGFYRRVYEAKGYKLAFPDRLDTFASNTFLTSLNSKKKD